MGQLLRQTTLWVSPNLWCLLQEPILFSCFLTTNGIYGVMSFWLQIQVKIFKSSNSKLVNECILSKLESNKHTWMNTFQVLVAEWYQLYYLLFDKSTNKTGLQEILREHNSLKNNKGDKWGRTIWNILGKGNGKWMRNSWARRNPKHLVSFSVLNF